MGQAECRYFVGTTTKNSLDYTLNEPIVFRIRAKEGNVDLDIPCISYSFTGDDGQAKSGFAPCAEDGWFYVETSLSKSGAVILKARACDADKNEIDGITPFVGGAVANAFEITSATQIPEDYFAFWDGLKKEVEQTPADVLFCQKIEESENPDFEIYDMRIRAPQGMYVSAMVSYPKGAEPGSLKMVMWFCGYGIGPVRHVDIPGYLSVYVNAHGIPNRATEAYYENLRQNVLGKYGFDEEENRRPETAYWAKMYLRDLQAVRFFKDHELVNKKDYIFSGSSQGGMQACNIACHSGIATGLLVNVPAYGDLEGPETMGRIKGSCPPGQGMRYFDTATAASFLKCPVYILSGLGDCTCPPCTQLSVYNAIKTPKYQEFYQNKGHSYTIPRDNIKYVLGDPSLADSYGEIKQIYYQAL